MKRTIRSLIFLCCVSACTVLGGSITIGFDNSGSFVPFGGGCCWTRYQEAYASGDFSGPISITGIDFFVQGGYRGDLYAGTYTLSLSIITANINSLSRSDLGSNLGPDNTVFTTVALSGASPNELSLTGGPFNYDPSLGNLLLDIQISGAIPYETLPGLAFEDGDAGLDGAGVAFYDDFSTGGPHGHGLVTEFDSSIPEPGTLSLLACGLVVLLVQHLRR